MPSYHQLGHHSENLIFESELGTFKGAVLSPVNYDTTQTKGQVTKCLDKKPGFDFIFDPQLYVPHSDRGVLKSWKYFPQEIDSADLSDIRWWHSLNDSLVSTIVDLKVQSVCSPANIPKQYRLDYYANVVAVGDDLVSRTNSKGISVYLTVLVHINSLADIATAMAIASAVTATTASAIYLVLVSDIEPRREFTDTESLKGAMRLIYEIENSGVPVLVAYSGSDLALWKYAGATSCSTGKFFNLRRFTAQRFEEPVDSGGGQLPYWYEESIMGFLRMSDLIRVRGERMLSGSSDRNPYSKEILQIVDSTPDKAWVGLGWRQYMHWFADFESRASNDPQLVKATLRQADENWGVLEDNSVLMEERRNDGRWVREWRRCLAEHLK